MAKTNFKQLSGIEDIHLNPDGSIVIKINQQNQEHVAIPTKEIQFEKDRISQTETADLFKVSVQTVINWGKKGIINKYKLGNRVFYLKSELFEAAKQNKQLVKI